MKKYFILLIWLSIMACQNDLIPDKNIKNIKIYTLNDDFEEVLICKITNRKQISNLVRLFNDSRKEPAKFWGNCIVKINYNTNTIRLVVNNEYFKIKGISYISKDNIEKSLELIIKAAGCGSTTPLQSN